MEYRITALYAGLLALLLLLLSARIVLLRRRLRVGIGDGGQPELARAVRVHANFTEHVPLALLLLLLLEQWCGAIWLHGYGIALLASRLLHAWGLGQSAGSSFGRVYGTLVTWILLLVGALALIVSGLSLSG